MNRRYHFILIVSVILLSACNGIAFSPEQAARTDLIQHNNAIPESVHIHQSQPWEDRIIMLSSYQTNENNQLTGCEAVFEMIHETTGWRTSGSGIGCTSPPSTEPVTFGSGTEGVPPDEMSYAHGLVKLDAAKWAEITWQDGTVQRAEVINGSYLALREGSFQMIARVDVLDAAEEVIHEIEIMSDIRKEP